MQSPEQVFSRRTFTTEEGPNIATRTYELLARAAAENLKLGGISVYLMHSEFKQILQEVIWCCTRLLKSNKTNTYNNL